MVGKSWDNLQRLHTGAIVVHYSSIVIVKLITGGCRGGCNKIFYLIITITCRTVAFVLNTLAILMNCAVLTCRI